MRNSRLSFMSVVGNSAEVQSLQRKAIGFSVVTLAELEIVRRHSRSLEGRWWPSGPEI